MIYLDTSVALAQLLAEDRSPPPSLWSETLVSSRLLEYELWVRIHARRLAGTHSEAARQLLGRIAFLELIPEVAGRVREGFPVELRTLDALHLASLLFIEAQGQRAALATYDVRMRAAAEEMTLRLYPLD